MGTKAAAALIALAALAGCARDAEEQGTCPVRVEGGWTAFINAMPGPGPRPRLVVAGQVTAPSGGWRLRLELGPVREIDPPVQEVLLRAHPPEGAATQALETFEVRGEFPAHNRYGDVVVRCRGEVVAQIGEVAVAR